MWVQWGGGHKGLLGPLASVWEGGRGGQGGSKVRIFILLLQTDTGQVYSEASPSDSRFWQVLTVRYQTSS